jgi:ABC-2 type transport system ATP-binding protein
MTVCVHFARQTSGVTAAWAPGQFGVAIHRSVGGGIHQTGIAIWLGGRYRVRHIRRILGIEDNSYERTGAVAVIDVQRLHKVYGEKVAVDDVSFRVEEGEIFGILGPNGAGKTTTVECVSGLRRPDGGSVRVLGYDPARDRDAVTARVGVQLQHSELQPNLRVGEALELFSSFYEEPGDWRELLDALGLGPQVTTRFAQLSGGQQQRLSIALALVGNPTLAILDELTTGLDPAARRDTWGLIEAVRDRGVTILLVTHFMAEAERLCDRVAVVDGGRVAALGSPGALTSRLEVNQRIRFTPSEPLDDSLLAALPEVESVSRRGEEVLVVGNTEALAAVSALLARRGVLAHHLRVEQPSLDDAFLAITERAEQSRAAVHQDTTTRGGDR